MEIDKINENVNYLVKNIQEENLNGFFKKVDKILDSKMDEENAVRLLSSALRIFLLEESSFKFINSLVERINNDYSKILKYDSINITLDILNVMVSKISKKEAIDNLFKKAKNANDIKDKMHAMTYLGNFILSSNLEDNQKYFDELEKLKEDKEYIVDNLNFDKITTRFNYDHYDILLQVTEIRLQKALADEDTEKIDLLMEEIIDATEKLEKEGSIDNYGRITMYSAAKMAVNSGYIDLEDYFMKLYNNTKFKGYVLESYFDYLNVNYPSRIDSNFREISKKYWEEHYEDDDSRSKKAFLFVMIDYISSYGKGDFNLEEILNEIDKIEDYKY
jgi:hypothetical protein